MSITQKNIAEKNAHADSRLRLLVGYNMKRAYHEIQTELAAALKELGLKVSSFAALATISHTPGLKQSVLADILNIEQANLVLLVDSLEKDKLIKRERASSDRRAYALFATQKGQLLCQQADRICQSLEAEFLAGFSGDEIAHLIGSIQQIEKQIKAKEQASYDRS